MANDYLIQSQPDMMKLTKKKKKRHQYGKPSTIHVQQTHRLSKGIVPQDCGCGVVVLAAMDNHYYRQ